LNKDISQQNFKDSYKLGVIKPKPFVEFVPENKHGIDNPVVDLNTNQSVSGNSIIAGLLTIDGSALTAPHTVIAQNANGTMTLESGALTNTRIPFANGSGILIDDADLTFTGGDTLNATKIKSSSLDINLTVFTDGSKQLTTTGKTGLIHGGTGSALSSPVSDKLWGWDNTDGSIGFWAIGTGLTYTHSTHTLSSSVTGQALTKTDDTNVTLTLGGSPTTALVNAASLTLGWTGQLAVGRGGTGATTLLGAGITAKTATIALTGQSADIGSTNLTTTGAGLYRLNYYLLDSSADLTAGAVRLNVAYTDNATSQTQQSATVALTILGTFTQGSLVIQLASGNIAYSTTHTGIFGTATYDLFITLERLN
jgi:hypothetical protein